MIDKKVIYNWVTCFSYNVYNLVYDDNIMRMMTIKTIIAFYFEIQSQKLESFIV